MTIYICKEERDNNIIACFDNYDVAFVFCQDYHKKIGVYLDIDEKELNPNLDGWLEE